MYQIIYANFTTHSGLLSIKSILLRNKVFLNILPLFNCKVNISIIFVYVFIFLIYNYHVLSIAMRNSF